MDSQPPNQTVATREPGAYAVAVAGEGTEAQLAAALFGSMRDRSDYDSLVEKAKDTKRWIKGVADYFKPMKDAAHKAHAVICEREKTTLAPALRDERVIKGAMDQWLDHEEAERQRIIREAQAAERERLETARLEEAAALEREGVEFGDASCIAEAHALIEQPIEVAAVSVHLEPVASNGVSRSTKARVVTVNDIKALALAVAEGRVPTSYILANQKLLDQQATALGKDFAAPGCVSSPKGSTIRITT